MKLTGPTLAPPDPAALVAISYNFTVPLPAAAKNLLSGEIANLLTCYQNEQISISISAEGQEEARETNMFLMI